MTFSIVLPFGDMPQQEHTEEREKQVVTLEQSETEEQERPPTPEEQARYDKYMEFMSTRHFAIYGRALVTSLLSIAICASLGYYMDSVQQTGHFFLLWGCIFGFFIAQLLIWLLTRNMLK